MNTRKYCVFFKTLNPGLQERVKQICESAENKSKIYSNIVNVIKILEKDEDIIRSVLKSQSFVKSFTSIKDQKKDLDAEVTKLEEALKCPQRGFIKMG